MTLLSSKDKRGGYASKTFEEPHEGLTDRKVGKDLSQEWQAQIAQTLRCIITHQK
jgi:hypothetical protein